MGVNTFTDLTAEEFRKKFLLSGGLRSGLSAHEVNDASLALSRHVDVADLPSSVDWRTKNVVTEPKNQGGCGSCWAFSTAETLESHIAIKTGKLMKFSPQEFVSCVPNPNHCGGTGGCQGST